MSNLFADVWIFRLARRISRKRVSQAFFEVFSAHGLTPDLSDNDHGKIVKFQRARYDSYSNDDPCLIKSRPGRPSMFHKELWHELSLGMVSNPVLVGSRPLLYASRFRGSLHCSNAISLGLLFELVADFVNYGYEVTLPIEMHAASYASKWGSSVFFGISNGPESFDVVGDQNEALFAMPRNVCPEMVLMKHSLGKKLFHKFCSLHQEFGGQQIDQGAYIVLRMKRSALPAVRAAMWEAGVIASNRLTANEWFVSEANPANPETQIET